MRGPEKAQSTHLLFMSYYLRSRLPFEICYLFLPVCCKIKPWVSYRKTSWACEGTCVLRGLFPDTTIKRDPPHELPDLRGGWGLKHEQPAPVEPSRGWHLRPTPEEAFKARNSSPTTGTATLTQIYFYWFLATFYKTVKRWFLLPSA